MKQPGRGDDLEALGALVADARRRGLRERDVEARAEQRWRARREATTGAWGRWIAGLAGTAVLACAAWVVVSSLRAPGALVAHVEERVLHVLRRKQRPVYVHSQPHAFLRDAALLQRV